jgi:hypothetical protein
MWPRSLAPIASLMLLVSGYVIAQQPYTAEILFDRPPSAHGLPVYQEGEAIRFAVRTTHDSYAYVFASGSDGLVLQVLPNYADADGQFNILRAGEWRSFPAHGAAYAFITRSIWGAEEVLVVVSQYPLDLSGLTVLLPGEGFARGLMDPPTFAGQLERLLGSFPQGSWTASLARYAVIPSSTTPAVQPYLQQYPYGLASYLSTLPTGQQLWDTHAPASSPYLDYIDSLTGGQFSGVTGEALDYIRRHRALGGVPLTLNPVRNTMTMVNAMMSDAMNLSAGEIERKYGGVSALAGAIAAQNEIYTGVYRHQLSRQASEQQSVAAMTQFEAELAEWRAAWSVWQSQLQRLGR